MFAEEEVVKSHFHRVRDLSLLVAIIFLILASRVAYLQLIQGDELSRYSVENGLRENVLWAPRGKIFDRNEKLLVDNIARFDIVITRQDLKREEQTITKLAEISNLEVKDIKKKLKRFRTVPKYKPILIKRNISKREIALIETQLEDLPGVSVRTSIKRDYLLDEVGAHLVGYISEISDRQLKKIRKRDDFKYYLGDYIGQRGIEEYFDFYLRGENGKEFLQVDAFGRKRKFSADKLYSEIKDIPANPGGKLKLTIDQDLQKKAYELLKDESSGLVAMDIETGEILAMVSTPSFQPSQFSSGLDPDYWKSLLDNKRKPLRDKVIQEHYAPGSTYKVITAFAGLGEGIITPTTSLLCEGSLTLGNRTYHCWNRLGHGHMNLRSALRESCNVYFQKIAKKIDIDTLSRYAKMFGLGKKTGISIKREIAGLIPTKKWKEKNRGGRWSKGETLSCSIGQSYVLTTILQLATLYGALGNGGKILKPKLIKELYDRDGKLVEKLNPEVVSNISLNAEELDIIQKGLFEVVNHPAGTAYEYESSKEKVYLAGKTGTAQVVSFQKLNNKKIPCDSLAYKYKHHAIFAGFAPYHNPKIAVAAILEHSCSGRNVVPVLKELLKVYLAKYYPEFKAPSVVEESKEVIRE